MSGHTPFRDLNQSLGAEQTARAEADEAQNELLGVIEQSGDAVAAELTAKLDLPAGTKVVFEMDDLRPEDIALSGEA